MPVHPQCQFVLDQMAASGARPVDELSPVEVRAQFALGLEPRKAMAGPEQPVARVQNLKVDAPGHSFPIRVYWPSTAASLPVLVYFHGGGFVVGDLEMVDRPCRALANASQCAIVSVDYPLSPESKFPESLEDAYRAVQYVAAHAQELGVDPARIAVGGDSAGGNLAAAVALISRDRGGPHIAFQLLVYPLTDYDDDRPSLHEFDGVFLTKKGTQWFWAQYLRNPEDGQSPYVSPIKAATLKGLPAAFVITAECDPLRDQGEAYAEKLRADGVAVKLKRYGGAIHAFFHMAAVIDSGREAVADAAQALREALGATRGAVSA